MNSFANSPLAWETGTLIFRNLSLRALKRRLEKQYETSIPMYHLLSGQWQADDSAHVSWEKVLKEIRLRLFLSYHPEMNQLQVRGVEWQP
ncbi:MAG: hypothetical protein AAF399_30835 [Bacteroidota bacterium]